jgi:hypothetical protein
MNIWVWLDGFVAASCLWIAFGAGFLSGTLVEWRLFGVHYRRAGPLRMIEIGERKWVKLGPTWWRRVREQPDEESAE